MIPPKLFAIMVTFIIYCMIKNICRGRRCGVAQRSMPQWGIEPHERAGFAGWRPSFWPPSADAPQVWAIGILILAVRSCYFVGRGLDPSLLALLLLYLSQNTFYYKGYCYKGAYKCVVV